MENEISSSTPERIRRRVSYREYAELTVLLVNDPTLEELARWFHQKLDKRRAYGSETCANYAYESLQQFVEDFKAKRKISELVNGSYRVTSNRVISKFYPSETKCLGCNWETDTLYSFPEDDIDEEGLCAQCFMEMIVQEQAEVSTGNIKPRMLESEICNECGESISPGSGRFVNRVPECNRYQERVNNGKPYPYGDFICAECDLKWREVEE